MNKLLYLFAIIFIGLTSCETMDDTYSEFRGDGPRKYLGLIKYDSVVISTGMKRVVLDWAKPIDPDVEKVIIKYGPIADSTKFRTVELEGDAVHWESPNDLTSGTHIFEIQTKSSDNRLSIPTNLYAEPFTMEHDKINGFGSVYNKYYYYKNDLIVILGLKNTKVKNASFTYKSGGEQKIYELSDEDYNQQFVVIPNVDSDFLAKVNMTASVEGCIDDVVFPEKDLIRDDLILASDFQYELKQKLIADNSNMEINHIRSIKEFYLDGDVNNITDLLFFEGLEKVVMGSWRFKDEDYKNKDFSGFREVQVSYKTMAYLHSKGVSFELYNDNYGHFDESYNWVSITNYLPFIVTKGNPVADEITFDSSDWEVTSESTNPDAGQAAYEAIGNLLDKDSHTYWNIQRGDKVRRHEVIVDMKDMKNAKGIFLTNPYQESEKKVYVRSMKVYAYKDLNDSASNSVATLVQDVIMNNGSGEKTKVLFSAPKDCRYIKLEFSDIPGYQNIRLADIEVF